jgi:hypothetical protein
LKGTEIVPSIGRGGEVDVVDQQAVQLVIADEFDRMRVASG